MFYTVAMARSTPDPEPPRLAPRREPPRRRTSLSVAEIVSAAIEVMDEQGVAALSMRRVADRLGTGPASLYVYVRGKDELLELVYDELVGQVSLPAKPDPKRWRAQVHQLLGDLRAVLMSHRDAALASLGRLPTSPNVLAGAESLVAVLRAGGLSDRAIALGFDQLILYVSACAIEAGVYTSAGMTDDQVNAYFTAAHEYFAALPQARFPVLRSIAAEMFGHDADERFHFGLDVLLDGLAK